MGDERTYENVCAIRAVDSTDAMTADWVKLPYDLRVESPTESLMKLAELIGWCMTLPANLLERSSGNSRFQKNLFSFVPVINQLSLSVNSNVKNHYDGK